MPAALETVHELVQRHEVVVRTFRSVFSLEDEANDQPTADLLTQLLPIHEKTGLMMQSLMEA
jgi:starvation-inducible DNA-binding protein